MSFTESSAFEAVRVQRDLGTDLRGDVFVDLPKGARERLFGKADQLTSAIDAVLGETALSLSTSSIYWNDIRVGQSDDMRMIGYDHDAQEWTESGLVVR